jgi:hypothetical protein
VMACMRLSSALQATDAYRLSNSRKEAPPADSQSDTRVCWLQGQLGCAGRAGLSLPAGLQDVPSVSHTLACMCAQVRPLSKRRHLPSPRQRLTSIHARCRCRQNLGHKSLSSDIKVCWERWVAKAVFLVPKLHCTYVSGCFKVRFHAFPALTLFGHCCRHIYSALHWSHEGYVCDGRQNGV